MRNSDWREMTMSIASPAAFLPFTVRSSSISRRPSYFDTTFVSTAVPPATPPTWNVRSVSCVPGSPMDCAAITPTTSPFCTMRAVARLRP